MPLLRAATCLRQGGLSCDSPGPTCEYWHQGAYNTTRVSLSRCLPTSCSSWSLPIASTGPVGHRSAASSLACPAAEATTLPECRPHSLPVASYTAAWISECSACNRRTPRLAGGALWPGGSLLAGSVWGSGGAALQSCHQYPLKVHLSSLNVHSGSGGSACCCSGLPAGREQAGRAGSPERSRPAAAHLPPPPALALMLVGQHCARAGLAANRDIALGMQRIGGNPLQQDPSLDVSRHVIEYYSSVSGLRWSTPSMRRLAARADQPQWLPDMPGCVEKLLHPSVGSQSRRAQPSI